MNNYKTVSIFITGSARWKYRNSRNKRRHRAADMKQQQIYDDWSTCNSWAVIRFAGKENFMS